MRPLRPPVKTGRMESWEWMTALLSRCTDPFDRTVGKQGKQEDLLFYLFIYLFLMLLGLERWVSG